MSSSVVAILGMFVIWQKVEGGMWMFLPILLVAVVC